MKIYDRDYREITVEEKEQWEKVKKEEVWGKDLAGNILIKVNKWSEYPKAVRHWLSLFPNNFLDPMDLKNNPKRMSDVLHRYLSVLDEEATNERTLLNFIKDHRAYYIVGAIFNSFTFGHHGAFVFPEFQIGNSFKIDFLLVGESSGGYQFIFVEFEHPHKNIFKKEGHLGDAFRKGLNQIQDWREWVQEYFPSFSETFEKVKGKNQSLPREFLKLDSSRFHYVVVAGRRSDFQLNIDKTYRIQREYLERKIHLLHYDNLYDMTKEVIRKGNY
ncbi:Shedu anti-phage system protein SduA domain-containing protein [Cytobacillus oceanisediminis]|uniref:Shedu protein SduA C-terminal domain-containing protein n=1 Tax=Cytobacillus oceanisediminis 2691 TaxID=1196031 RepID=A0A160MEY2_9BACI|nr:Shedu anti-phage system protein SduA domain-containing protein [Cytobacillus oceanisediminis]AND41483.1 hypothetical protein A361_20730 [Cytobacillus oceanisediminis 2691]